MLETKVAQEEVAPAESELSLSELHDSIWSLVSFEKCVESSLTYDQAVAKMNELLPQKVSGLCIITDEAARNI